MDIYFWYIMLKWLNDLRLERERLEKEALDMQQELDGVAETSEIVLVMDTPENALTYKMAISLDSGQAFSAKFFEEAHRMSLLQLNMAAEQGARPDELSRLRQLEQRNQKMIEIARTYDGQVMTADKFEKVYNTMLDEGDLYTSVPKNSLEAIHMYERFDKEAYLTAVKNTTETQIKNPASMFVASKQMKEDVRHSFLRRANDAFSPRYAERVEAMVSVFLANNEVMDARRNFKFNFMGVTIDSRDVEFQKIVNAMAPNLKTRNRGAFSPELMAHIDEMSLYIDKQANQQGVVSEARWVHMYQAVHGEIEPEKFLYGKYTLAQNGIIAKAKLSEEERKMNRKIEKTNRDIDVELVNILKYVDIGDISVARENAQLGQNESIREFVTNNAKRFLGAKKVKKLNESLDKIAKLSKQRQQLRDYVQGLKTAVDMGVEVTASSLTKGEKKAMAKLNNVLEQEQLDNLMRNGAIFLPYDKAPEVEFTLADMEGYQYVQMMAQVHPDLNIRTPENFPDLVAQIGQYYSQENKDRFESLGLNHSIGETEFVLFEPGSAEYLIISMDPLQDIKFYHGNSQEGIGSMVINEVGERHYPNATEISTSEANQLFLKMNQQAVNQETKVQCTSISNYLSLATVPKLNLAHDQAPLLSHNTLSQTQAPNIFTSLSQLATEVKGLDDYHPKKILTHQFLSQAQRYLISQEYYDLERLKSALEQEGSLDEKTQNRLNEVSRAQRELEETGCVLSEERMNTLASVMVNLEKGIKDPVFEKVEPEVLGYIEEYLNPDSSFSKINEWAGKALGFEQETSLLQELETEELLYIQQLQQLYQIEAELGAKQAFVKEITNDLIEQGVDITNHPDVEKAERVMERAKAIRDELALDVSNGKAQSQARQLIIAAGLGESQLSREHLRSLQEGVDFIQAKEKEIGLEDHFGLSKEGAQRFKNPESVMSVETDSRRIQQIESEAIGKALVANEIDEIYLQAFGPKDLNLSTLSKDMYHNLDDTTVNIVKALAEVDKNDCQEIELRNTDGTLTFGLTNESMIKMEYAKNFGAVGHQGRNVQLVEQNLLRRISTPTYLKTFANYAQMLEGDRDQQRLAAIQMMASENTRSSMGEVEGLSQVEVDALERLITMDIPKHSDKEIYEYQQKKERGEIDYDKLSPKEAAEIEELEESMLNASSFDEQMEKIKAMALGSFLETGPVATGVSRNLASAHRTIQRLHKIDNQIERAQQLTQAQERSQEHETQAQALESGQLEKIMEGEDVLEPVYHELER